MKKIVLAALTVLSLGAGAASAATWNSHTPTQQGNNYNFTEGGGG
jgi:hypothetical protein